MMAPTNVGHPILLTVHSVSGRSSGSWKFWNSFKDHKWFAVVSTEEKDIVPSQSAVHHCGEFPLKWNEDLPTLISRDFAGPIMITFWRAHEGGEPEVIATAAKFRLADQEFQKEIMIALTDYKNPRQSFGTVHLTLKAAITLRAADPNTKGSHEKAITSKNDIRLPANKERWSQSVLGQIGEKSMFITALKSFLKA